MIGKKQINPNDQKVPHIWTNSWKGSKDPIWLQQNRSLQKPIMLQLFVHYGIISDARSHGSAYNGPIQ